MDSIRKRVIKVLNDNEVSIIPELDDEKILLDSIEFISVIVGLEEEFNIAIPEEFLTFEALQTIEQFVNMISFLVH
ncbi:MAG: phosphopantetheine-binding protein [Christensenellales bacterium]